MSDGIGATLPERGLVAVTWSGVGLAGVILAARIAVRWFKYRKITHADDILIYAAFITLVCSAFAHTYQAPYIYIFWEVGSGFLPQTNFTPDVVAGFVQFNFATNGLFFTVIWLVKASFLAFFYPMFDTLPAYRKAWWGVTIFTFLNYCGCWIVEANQWHEASLGFLLDIINGVVNPLSTNFVRGGYIDVLYNTIADIVTDCAIMGMALTLLWKVKISVKERIGLAVIFSVVWFTIATAIVRAAETGFRSINDPVLLSLMEILETSIAVMVGCLPPFKSIFTDRRPMDHNVPRSKTRDRKMQARNRDLDSSIMHSDFITSVGADDGLGGAKSISHEGNEEFVEKIVAGAVYGEKRLDV